MFGLGPTEMIVIGVVAVLLFGGKLPEVAKQFGSTYQQFRNGLHDMQQQFRMAEYEAKRNLSVDDTPETSGVDEEDEESAGPSVPKFKPPA